MAGKSALNEQCPRPINVATDHSAEWCKKNGHCGCVELEVLRKEYGEAVYPLNKESTADSPWRIGYLDADDEANEMHEAVAKEIATRLLQGETFDEREGE